MRPPLDKCYFLSMLPSMPLDPEDTDDGLIGKLFSFDDQGKSLIAAGDLTVPCIIELHDGHICYQFDLPGDQRLTRPSGAANGPSDDDAGQSQPSHTYSFSQSPSPRLLDGFAHLADAPDERILGYARRWGVLGLCRHGQPQATSEQMEWYGWGHDSPRPCPALKWKDSKGRARYTAGRERLEHWRLWAQRAKSVLRIAANLSSKRPGALEDWAQLYPMAPEDLRDVRRAVEEHSNLLALDHRLINNLANQWVFLGGVGPRLVSRKSGAAVIRFSSPLRSGLFGALGLQLLIRVSTKGMAICSGCGDLYVPKRVPDVGRLNFCVGCGREAAVRLAKKRLLERQKTAREMRARGDTVSEIAESLESKPAVVRGWLAPKVRRPK